MHHGQIEPEDRVEADESVMYEIQVELSKAGRSLRRFVFLSEGNLVIRILYAHLVHTLSTSLTSTL